MKLLSDYTEQIAFLRAAAKQVESPTLRFRLTTIADDLEYIVGKANKILAEINADEAV